MLVKGLELTALAKLKINFYICNFLIINYMHRELYETPKAEAVVIETEGVICDSPVLTMFLLNTIPSSEVDFGRETYGSATSETWN